MNETKITLESLSPETKNIMSIMLSWLWNWWTAIEIWEIMTYAVMRTQIRNDWTRDNNLSDLEKDWYNAFILLKNMLLSGGWVSEENMNEIIWNIKEIIGSISIMGMVKYWTKKYGPEGLNLNANEINILYIEYLDNVELDDICKTIVEKFDCMLDTISFIFVDYINDENLIKLDEDMVSKKVPLSKRLEIAKNRLKLVDELEKQYFKDTKDDRITASYNMHFLGTLLPRIQDKKLNKLYNDFLVKANELYALYFAQTLAAKKRLIFDRTIPNQAIEDNWDLDKKYKDIPEFVLLTDSSHIVDETKEKSDIIKKELDKIHSNITSITKKHNETSNDEVNKKICEFCWEEIQEKALKCRFCWEWFKEKDIIVDKSEKKDLKEEAKDETSENWKKDLFIKKVAFILCFILTLIEYKYKNWYFPDNGYRFGQYFADGWIMFWAFYLGNYLWRWKMEKIKSYDKKYINGIVVGLLLVIFMLFVQSK